MAVLNGYDVMEKYMANRPYILVDMDPFKRPTFWYRQAIYFDLKVTGVKTIL